MTTHVDDFIRIIPIGGVGEFGSNGTVVATPQTSVLIDNGLLFPPDGREPGVEYYVRDPDEILQNFPDLSAVIVTHGHEDHIGGLPFLLEKRALPVHALPYTAALIRQKLEGTGIHPDFRTFSLGKPFSIEDLTVEPVGVTHSIVGSCALALKHAAGTIVHSGDFKVDPLPGDDQTFDEARFRSLGDEGVDVLLMDSTNAHQRGFSLSEFQIQEPLSALINDAPGRVFFTTFASHMPRLKRLTDIARRTGRKIVLMGRSFLRHYQLALETEYLTYSPGTFIELCDAQELSDRDLIFVITGSQGERGSVLSRIARDSYQKVKLKANDTVIFSSRSIPGNERVIALLISTMESKGVRVITSKDDLVHTSGHGFREDSAFLLSLVRPKTVVPFHGEYHHLLTHTQWLKRIARDGQEVLLIQNGDFLTLRHGVLEQDGHMSIRLLPIDGNQELPLDNSVLQERKDLMYSGLLIVCGRADPSANRYRFEVSSHGMAEPEPGFVAAQIELILNRAALVPKNQPTIGKHLLKLIRSALREFFKGRPLIKIILNGKICV